MRIIEIMSEDKDALEKINEDATGQEVVLAYDEDDDIRDLDMRGTPVSLGDWEMIMSKALEGSGGEYGNFIVREVARALGQAMKDLNLRTLAFRPGREGSVVLYVHSDSYDDLEDLGEYIHRYREMFNHVDELDLHEGGYKDVPGHVLRLWWD